MTRDEERIHQMIREMHCDRREEKGHVCVGECTIRKDGIELNCKLCGPAVDVIYQDSRFHLLNKALRRIGIDSTIIDPQIIQQMLIDLYP